MERQFLFSKISSIKDHIFFEIKKQRWNNALGLISLCATILYYANPYYRDDDLENAIELISKKFVVNEYKKGAGRKENIIVYDGFGLDNRGLIHIYLKALCQKYNVIYVTFAHKKNKITNILSILNKNHSKVVYLNKYFRKRTSQIQELINIVKKANAGKFIGYCLPYDVVCTTAMYMLDGYVERYMINLTDHAFWLGSGCIDKCLEFREYGAAISAQYRKIDKHSICIIPFYPNIPFNQSFLGFPFQVSSTQKVMFSGGQLYKTIGDNNRYYKMIDSILFNHPEIIFWYAGTGDDTEMQKLVKKYPNRVYLTYERSDLYQLLENISIYISTYPFPGGLMYQYAALAGKVPVTLRKGEVTEGFLINQKNINIEFNTEAEVYEEIDKLLSNQQYYDARAEQMKKAVISENGFNQSVWLAMEGNVCFDIFDKIETTEFRNDSIKRMTDNTFKQCFAINSLIAFVYYPNFFIEGWALKVKTKLKLH